MVWAFGLYWGGITFEYLSTHYCWALSKSFIPSLVVWSVRKTTHLAEKSKIKKSNGEQSDLCDPEKVTLKPQLQVHHCLTTWLQIWYHSLLWGDSIRKGADLEKQNCLFGVHTRGIGEINFLLLHSDASKDAEFLNRRKPSFAAQKRQKDFQVSSILFYSTRKLKIFRKNIFRKNYILKKVDRVARRGPRARAPGALKGGHFRNCQHFCRSWRGDPSEKKQIFEKNLTMPKNWKGGPFGILNTQSVVKYQRNWRGKIFIFGKKVSQCQKK